MYKLFGITVILSALSLQLTACGDKSEKNTAEDIAIAKVNGEPVYASDLQVIRDRMLGNVPEKYIDKSVEEKLLNSLLRSRAMSQLMQKEMEQDRIKKIESQVKAFRDDLYVRAYVQKHGQQTKITDKEAKEYYLANLNAFGGTSKKTLETITVRKNKDESLQKKALKMLSDLKTNKNWKTPVDEMKAKGIAASYSKQLINERFLKSPLKEVVLKMNKQSEPQLISGDETYLVRVLDVQQVPAKPFAEVSGEIRKLLQRQSYRKAVETLSEQVMQQVEVEIK